ncbi:DNA-binding protein [Anaerocolumna sp. AGMB13020]|uniref:YlxM family DNA-binding protein n=1 Tax=Anaerocolumna sp. AGMB13020 TaxID=3081750 RepID=UPI0029537EEE|nr:DNA-binding protein [Anaerocolumna sp. AGMB13020]WOO36923.1 DNA-binding protein [Anaerocolumna sp. AGMB13020]
MESAEMNQKLQEKVYLSLLFDFYGELLKDHNKQIFEDYILNDLSLGEIAALQGISRQGVYDIVKRGSKQLNDCEKKLGLARKFESTRQIAEEIHQLACQLKTGYKDEDLDSIISLSQKMVHEL